MAVKADGASVPTLAPSAAVSGPRPQPSSTGMLSNYLAPRPARDPNQLYVFMGYNEAQNAPEPGGAAGWRGVAGPRTVRTDDYMTITDALTAFEGWSDKKKRTLARRLALGGFFSDSPNQGETLNEFLSHQTLGDVSNAYLTLLTAAGSRYTQANIKVTPEQLLQQNIDFNRGNPGGGPFAPDKDGGSGGTGSPYANKTIKHTDVSKSIDIYSPSDARWLIRQVLSDQLDREPTEDEFADFIDALQEEAREHPTTSRTTTRTKYDEFGSPMDTSTRTVSRGGFNPNEFAVEYAQSQPGWAEWQAVGTYFPAAMAALGAGVPGV